MAFLLILNLLRQLLYSKYMLMKKSLCLPSYQTSGELSIETAQNILMATEFVSLLNYFRNKYPLHSIEMNLSKVSDAPTAT